jgi:hypothetical protein
MHIRPNSLRASFISRILILNIWKGINQCQSIIKRNQVLPLSSIICLSPLFLLFIFFTWIKQIIIFVTTRTAIMGCFAIMLFLFFWSNKKGGKEKFSLLKNQQNHK